MIESYLLEELVVFAQTGTLTKTASQLNVTQPSVTRGMQKLEDDFGVKLFARQSNRIQLTATGELAAKEAAKLLEMNTAMVTKVQNFDHGRHTINLGATVPGALLLLNHLQLDLNERVHIDNDHSLTSPHITGVLNNDQYAVVFSNQELITETVESQYVGEERLNVNLDQFTYLANQPAVTFKELDGMSFIVMHAIGPWEQVIQSEITNAKFMYQDDRESFTEITKHSRFPFFTTNLSQSDPHFQNTVNNDKDRVTVPISDDRAQMPIYANYLTSQKKRLTPLIRELQQKWPNSLPTDNAGE